MGFCSALHSKLMQFHSTEKYSDVQVRVQDKSFPCHRVVLAAASEYFDALFGGSFMEKDARETVLHDVDVETFMEILRCMYTGRMCEITASNVFNLLSASLFLRIHFLEEACTQYILKNLFSIQNHIPILALARSMNMTALINAVTEHVTQHFRLFYYDETLLEMTFDDLSFLLEWWSKRKLLFKYEDFLLHFLIRWVYHASKQRRKYFIKLLAAVDFERISLNCVTFMMQHYKGLIEQPGLEGMSQLNLPPVVEESVSTSYYLPVYNWHDNTENSKSRYNWHDDTENSKSRLCLKRKLSKYFAGKGKLSAICDEEVPAPYHDPTFDKDVLGLHLYVEYINIDCHDVHKRVRGSRRCSEGVKILSPSKHCPDWFVSCEVDAWRSCVERRTIVQESTNRLYCMELFNNTGGSFFRQTFCTYSSTDLKVASSVLTSPPIPILDVNCMNMFATSENDVYLFRFGMHSRPNNFPANDQFSLEEINRGFYHYNCEVDKWFPAPQMKTLQDFPILCADHNLIYSIGGETPGLTHSKTFQAFDYRSGKWMALPMCIADCDNDWDSKSCILQNQVFVSRGAAHTYSYDTVAGKWESICWPKKYGKLRKMVPYDNKLWLLMCKSSSYLCDFTSLVTYSPITQEWYHDDGFNDVILRGQPNRTDGTFKYECHIKDMITFKTCS